MPGEDPLAQIVESWRSATESYLAAWNRAFEAGMETEAGSQALREMRDTYLGTQTKLQAAAREYGEPAIAAAGGVPLSEFRRLADQVHTLLLRLDRIDDRLDEIVGRLDQTSGGPPK